MLRGDNALTDIVSNETEITSDKHPKGCFTGARDEAMACRFFYYACLKGLRFDLCLSILSNEFFLSCLVISQRLMKQQEFLKQLKANQTTANDLNKRYPAYNWKV